MCPVGQVKLIQPIRIGAKNAEKIYINTFSGEIRGETSKTFHQNVPQKYNSRAREKEQNSLKSQSWENCSCIICFLLAAVTGLDIENFPSSSLTLYQDTPSCNIIHDCQLRNLFFSLDMCTVLVFDGSSICCIFTITGLICWSILYGPIQNCLNEIGSLAFLTGLK